MSAKSSEHRVDDAQAAAAELAAQIRAWAQRWEAPRYLAHSLEVAALKLDRYDPNFKTVGEALREWRNSPQYALDMIGITPSADPTVDRGSE